MKFFTKLSLYTFFAGVFLHLLSFLSYFNKILNYFGFFFILISVLFFLFKKYSYAWLILIFELLIGHDGHLFEFKDVSIRLALFTVLFFFWFGKKILFKETLSISKNKISFNFLLLLFFIIFGSWYGIIRNGFSKIVFGDIVNYSFILLFLPLKELIKEADFKKKLFQITNGAILVLFFLSFISLILFSSGILYVHEPSGYYWWFRNYVNGKITKMDFNFFRIVTPGHLIILPIFLIYLSLLLTKETKKIDKFLIALLAFLSSFIILVNFGRAYLLGLIAGLLFLKNKIRFKKWFYFVLIVIFSLFLEMVMILYLVSHFKPESISLLEERLSTLLGFEEELSILTREQRFRACLDMLIQNPILGTGLGTSITFIDPITLKRQITYHLDWGYFEIWLELTLFGLIAFLSFIYLLIKESLLKANTSSNINQRFYIGIGSGLISLTIATLTGPYIFHNLGLFYLALTAAILNNYETKN
jgi:O-antigen ligase